MSDTPDRLGTLQLIIGTLSRVDEDPASRLAEIRGLLFGEANRDPKLATLVQTLPPLEAEAEALRARLRQDRDMVSDIADVKDELPALRTDVERVLAEHTQLQQELETAQAAAQRWQGFAERLRVNDDRFINEGGTCNWCGKDAYEDVDTDELDDEEIEALPKHEEDCPVIQARALLEKET